MVKELVQRVVELALIGLLFVALSGCQAVKGLCGDVEWTAGKLNDAIVVPE